MSEYHVCIIVHEEWNGLSSRAWNTYIDNALEKWAFYHSHRELRLVDSTSLHGGYAGSSLYFSALYSCCGSTQYNIFRPFVSQTWILASSYVSFVSTWDADAAHGHGFSRQDSDCVTYGSDSCHDLILDA